MAPAVVDTVRDARVVLVAVATEQVVRAVARVVLLVADTEQVVRAVAQVAAAPVVVRAGPVQGGPEAGRVGSVVPVAAQAVAVAQVERGHAARSAVAGSRIWARRRRRDSLPRTRRYPRARSSCPAA